MIVQSTKSYGVSRLKMLIYGLAGVGKTTLAGTLDDAVIISAESGLLSLSDKEIDVLDTTINDAKEIIPRQDRDMRLSEIYAYLQTEDARSKYKTIFIDSLSEINDNFIEKYQKIYPDKKDTFSIWNDVTKSMTSMIRAFRDLPYYNVVMTALETQDKDENGRFFKGPLVKPKSLAEDLPKYFDYVFHMYKVDLGDNKSKPMILTQPTETVRAKSRITKEINLETIEEADLKAIFNKIKGGN